MMITLETAVRLVAENSLRASLLILCVCLLRVTLGRRLPAQFLHLLWILVVLRLLLPVAPASSWSVFNLWQAHTGTSGVLDPTWRVRTEPAGISGPARPAPAAPSVTAPVEAQRRVEVQDWLALVWLGGVLWQTLLLGRSAWQTRRMLHSARVPESNLKALAQECFAATGCRGRLRLLETTALASPAVLGLWRPRLLIPTGFSAALPAEEMRLVLLHECAHLRRRDLPFLWLLTAARVVHWFNPLVWLAAALARTDAELACDETVLRRFADPDIYGRTLLKVAQNACGPKPAVPCAGIWQGKRALRVRLGRIGVYTRPSMVGTAVGAAAFLAIAVAFGANEERPAAREEPPAPASPTAPTAETSAWAAGWKIVRIAIPSSGQLEHAFVDFITPDGREVTLTDGVLSKEGVVLEKVEWTGSPVRAKATLRKGKERAELTVDAGLVLRDDALQRRLPQVEIVAQFVEIPNAMAQKLPVLKDRLAPGGIRGKKEVKRDRAWTMQDVITAQKRDELLAALHQTMGADLLSAPRVTALSQQKATIEIIREFRYATDWEPPDGKNKHWTPKTFETRNVGVTLTAEATVNDDGTLSVKLEPEVVEFLGFRDFTTKLAAGEAKHPPGGPALGRMFRAIDLKDAKLGDRKTPVFDVHKATAELTLSDAQTAVLILEGAKETKPFTSPNLGRTLVAIVTVRRLTPEDLAAHLPEGGPHVFVTTTGEIPMGVPVEGKPGYVTSPHAPQAGFIDIRGFTSGTEIKDPYSGKFFRVP